jgi:ABC-type antimicrobial peptide transport system permease subunit
MIAVETKTYETAVLRIVGMNSANVVSMILIQSIAFVLPSILVGYILSVPSLSYIFHKIFTPATGVNMPPIPTAKATIQALVLGLLIPIVSSVIPIKVSLDCTLSENLTKTRSRTKGQQVDI